MTSLLSPLAAPFDPAGKYEDLEWAIYNDGMPCMVPKGEHGQNHEVVHGLSDDAIDECFPPTAEEVAEMEEAEKFVETLADISIMEDREEKARATFNHLTKRWATRRQEGLTRKKPLPARGVLEPSSHQDMPPVLETSLTQFENFNKVLNLLEKRHHGKEYIKENKARNPKNIKGMHGFKAPIQQPRKHY